MIDRDIDRILFAIGLACTSSVHAQIPLEVLERLSERGVVVTGQHVYAKASGNIRGTRESSEAFYVTRATRNMANYFCDFAVAPGKRLAVELEGVTLVMSTEVGKVLDVVIRAPVQKPSCKVTLVDAVMPSLSPPKNLEIKRADESLTSVTESGSTRTKDIVIRNFGGEH